ERDRHVDRAVVADRLLGAVHDQRGLRRRVHLDAHGAVRVDPAGLHGAERAADPRDRRGVAAFGQRAALGREVRRAVDLGAVIAVLAAVVAAGRDEAQSDHERELVHAAASSTARATRNHLHRHAETARCTGAPVLHATGAARARRAYYG